MEDNPYQPSTTNQTAPAVDERSLPRGCGYGCLYSGCSWIAITGLVVFVIAPLVGRQFGLDVRRLSAILTQLGLLFIVIPFGIYGLIIHWRKDHNKRPTPKKDLETPDEV